MDYARSVRRLTLRWRQKNGDWRYAVWLPTLEPRDVISLLRQLVDQASNASAGSLGYAKLAGKWATPRTRGAERRPFQYSDCF